MIEDNLASRNSALTADFSLAIINVVFLLLFFFILTGSVVQRSEMEVRAPFTQNLPLERLPRPLIVVSEKQELFLNGVPITLKKLKDQIVKPPIESSKKVDKLNILADGKLSAKHFLKIVEDLRTTGLPLRVVTIREIEKNRE